MKRIVVRVSAVLFLFALFSLFLYAGRMIDSAVQYPVFGYGTAQAQENGLSKVIFKVQCYDDGKAALRGLKGVQKIETGFHYLSETDTVYYDPKVITVEEMEKALKRAGTYIGTITIKKERN